MSDPIESAITSEHSRQEAELDRSRITDAVARVETRISEIEGIDEAVPCHIDDLRLILSALKIKNRNSVTFPVDKAVTE